MSSPLLDEPTYPRSAERDQRQARCGSRNVKEEEKNHRPADCRRSGSSGRDYRCFPAAPAHHGPGGKPCGRLPDPGTAGP